MSWFGDKPGSNLQVMASGPVIAPTPRPHPDQLRTVRPDAAELMAQAPPNKCLRRGCGGVLGVRRGIINILTPNGNVAPEDSERCRRQSYVACQKCGEPVPVNHPMQVKLDADWKALEDKERQEAERLAKAPPAPAPAQPINPVLETLDDIQTYLDGLALVRGDLQRLTYRLAALEKRLGDLEKRPAAAAADF